MTSSYATWEAQPNLPRLCGQDLWMGRNENKPNKAGSNDDMSAHILNYTDQTLQVLLWKTLLWCTQLPRLPAREASLSFPLSPSQSLSSLFQQCLFKLSPLVLKPCSVPYYLSPGVLPLSKLPVLKCWLPEYVTKTTGHKTEQSRFTTIMESFHFQVPGSNSGGGEPSRAIYEPLNSH